MNSLLIIYLILFRFITFDLYKTYIIVSLYTLILYLFLGIFASELHGSTVGANFLVLLLFLFVQNLEVNLVNYRTRQLF